MKPAQPLANHRQPGSRPLCDVGRASSERQMRMAAYLDAWLEEAPDIVPVLHGPLGDIARSQGD